MTMHHDGLAPPRPGHRYHVRIEHHPGEEITFTAWCRETIVGRDRIESHWDNGVILVAPPVGRYYPNDPGRDQ